jgi:hypothetical protein
METWHGRWRQGIRMAGEGLSREVTSELGLERQEGAMQAGTGLGHWREWYRG